MDLGRLLLLAAIALPFALALRAFVVEGTYVASASMEPTLKVGTHAIVDKLTYRFRPPRRGDIVAFQEPIPPHTEMVKRVVGTPGDRVELRSKKLYVNGEFVYEGYVQHTRQGERLDGDDLGPLEVPPGHAFLLGDNRDESNDASVWRDPGSGEPVYFVPFSRIRGKLRGFY